MSDQYPNSYRLTSAFYVGPNSGVSPSSWIQPDMGMFAGNAIFCIQTVKYSNFCWHKFFGLMILDHFYVVVLNCCIKLFHQYNTTYAIYLWNFQRVLAANKLHKNWIPSIKMIYSITSINWPLIPSLYKVITKAGFVPVLVCTYLFQVNCEVPT